MKSGIPKKQRFADERRKAPKPAGAPVSARQKRPRSARGGARGS